MKYYEIIRSPVRRLLSLLSLPFNDNLSKISSKEKKILQFLSNKAKKLKSNTFNINIKDSHKAFGKKVLNLVINKDIRNFLVLHIMGFNLIISIQSI